MGSLAVALLALSNVDQVTPPPDQTVHSRIHPFVYTPASELAMLTNSGGGGYLGTGEANQGDGHISRLQRLVSVVLED